MIHAIAQFVRDSPDLWVALCLLLSLLKVWDATG